MKKTLVTGGTGFLGSALVQQLLEKEQEVVVPVRSDPGGSTLHFDMPVVGNIDGNTNWQQVMQGVELVIHSAARVHVMNEIEQDPLAAFRAVNVEGTLNLARQAASAGVCRFVFISSIKVNGEHTDDRPPFTPDDPPAPEDPYAVSKWEAEAGLRELAHETGMEVVIVRPPLVYGAGVKGNFFSLLKLAGLPLPLPFGAINNRRSLVYLGNLVDFILHAAQHPAAANETFLISDGVDLSTTELLRLMREARGRRGLLIPVPGLWLCRIIELAGRGGLAQRLCGSLQLDISKSRQLLGWAAPYSVDSGLKETVSWAARC